MATRSKKEAQSDEATEAFKRSLIAKHTDVQETDWMNRSVNMSNALVSAAQGLTLREKRLMALAVSKIDSLRHHGLQTPKVRVDASEYAELAAIDPANAYKDLESAARHIQSRTITFEHDWKDPSKNTKKIHRAITRTNWVQAATYIEGAACVELLFSLPVLPHLTMLRERFTSYKLQQAHALRSLYSWRLLELLSQFKSTGWREFDVEDFAMKMELSEQYRKNFAFIRRRVIEPAVLELHEKDGWIIRWNAIKTGRKVSRLRFEFQKNPQKSLFD